MAYAAWKDITIQHGRSGPLFRVYDAVTNKLAGDLAGKWTLVDRSTADVWTSDTSPADGSWLVLQSETPRGDGSKLQVFLGFRNATGNLAGFGSKAAGVYSCMSHDGGWNAVDKVFGASLSDWRNGGIKGWPATYATPCTMAVLFFTAGDTGRPGSFCVLVRSGTAENHGTFAGGLIPLTGLDHEKSRTVHLCGLARLTDWSTYWGQVNGAQGSVPTVALDALDGARAGTGTTTPARDRETGAYTEADAPVVDVVTATSLGVLELVRITNMPNGDISIDGTRHAWADVSFPREAARDGIWI